MRNYTFSLHPSAFILPSPHSSRSRLRVYAPRPSTLFSDDGDDRGDGGDELALLPTGD